MEVVLVPRWRFLLQGDVSRRRIILIISYNFISLQLGIGCASEMGRVRDETTAGMHSDLLTAC